MTNQPIRECLVIQAAVGVSEADALGVVWPLTVLLVVVPVIICPGCPQVHM
jgi:hypothetical protein